MSGPTGISIGYPDMVEIKITASGQVDTADELSRAMVSPEMVERLRAEITAVVQKTVAETLTFAPSGTANAVPAFIEDFFSLYPHRPVKDNKGGSKLNDSLWLYVMGRSFAPDLIVESGTFKGHSAWLFRQACPQAEIHLFDIDFSNLVFFDPAATYHECDWSKVAMPTAADGRRSIAFFDDHINQARRLREAYNRGFRLLLFDDNFPAYNLYATGGPPVPTLAMVMDSQLYPGMQLQWTRNGKHYSYTYRREDECDARELIDQYIVLPDLAQITRYNPGSTLTVVKLVD